MKIVSKWAMGVAAMGAVVSLAGTGTTALAARANTVTLAETGSSLLYPLFNGEWVPAYHKLRPWVQITSASTGSGAGQSQSIAGTVQIGASDAYLADAQMQANPSMVNIPLAISAQQVMYNLPGMKKNFHLKLTGGVLAQIYEGKINYWNDKAIAKLNKGVKLPHKQITSIVRSDGSGDTFLFTQFLTSTDSTWANSVAYGTSVSWPANTHEIGAKGNNGVVDALKANPYSVAYVGISWLNQAVKEGMGYAALQNKAGNFIIPTTKTIQAAADVAAKNTPKDERISLIYAPGKESYPIINFEYAIVNTHQHDKATTVALKQFLLWAVNPKWGGNKATYLVPVHFLPLPAKIRPLSEKQINMIGH